MERSCLGIETTLRAMEQCLTIRLRQTSVICEYDVLPEIGHTCGHNATRGWSSFTFPPSAGVPITVNLPFGAPFASSTALIHYPAEKGAFKTSMCGYDGSSLLS